MSIRPISAGMGRLSAGIAVLGCASGAGGLAAGSADGSVAAVRPASGIAGRIVAGPTCPVESVPPDPRCAPRPLSARVQVRRAGHPRVLELIHSGSDGRFRARLAPGTYILTPLALPGSPFPRPPAPLRERVRPGRFTHLTITYDTGIR